MLTDSYMENFHIADGFPNDNIPISEWIFNISTQDSLADVNWEYFLNMKNLQPNNTLNDYDIGVNVTLTICEVEDCSYISQQEFDKL